MSEESVRFRERLVAALTANGSLREDRVREAFRAVPRELFVPMIHAVRGLAGVYADAALVTKERDGAAISSSSQPSIMAQMLEALRLREGAGVGDRLGQRLQRGTVDHDRRARWPGHVHRQRR